MTKKIKKLSIEAVEGTVEGAKRQHAPAVLRWTCPECGAEHETDYRREYLSYPEIGGVEEETLYCGDCDDNDIDCEYTVKLSVRLTLELVEN